MPSHALMPQRVTHAPALHRNEPLVVEGHVVHALGEPLAAVHVVPPDAQAPGSGGEGGRGIGEWRGRWGKKGGGLKGRGVERGVNGTKSLSVVGSTMVSTMHMIGLMTVRIMYSN